MRYLLEKISLIMLLVVLGLSASNLVHAQTQTASVNADPDFDLFYTTGDGNSGAWKPFKLGNNPSIYKHVTEGWPKGPSLYIYADAKTFDGGVYQQVTVTPGHGYHFEVAWAVVRHSGALVRDDVQLVRTIGIDPYGGTNPLSPNVRWCPDYYGTGKFPPELAIDEFARNTQITIFIRAQNRYTDSRNEVFFDHAVLTDNGQTIQVTVATNTPTAAPKAAATATKVPPTPTRALGVNTPTTAKATVPTITLTPSPLPSPTLENTSTPLPTRTPRATPTPESVSSLNVGDSPMLLIFGMVACVIGAGGLVILAGVAYWVLHRRQSSF
jgi:hypothetical protein